MILLLTKVNVSRCSSDAALGQCKFLELIVVVSEWKRCSRLCIGTVAVDHLRRINVGVNRSDLESGASGTLAGPPNRQGIERLILLYEVFAGLIAR